MDTATIDQTPLLMHFFSEKRPRTITMAPSSKGLIEPHPLVRLNDLTTLLCLGLRPLPHRYRKTAIAPRSTGKNRTTAQNQSRQATTKCTVPPVLASFFQRFAHPKGHKYAPFVPESVLTT